MQNDNQLLAWLQSSGIPTTPFAEGQLRLHPEIAIFPSKRMTSLRKAAFALEQAYDALCSILIQQKEFLTEYFSFSPTQEILWNISGGRWRGIARADVFYKNTGEIAIAELNSDTPSGLDEAFLLGQYAESKITGFYNPNKNIAASFTALITEAFHKVSNPSARPTVGIVYPTDIPEDMGLLFLYRQWLQQEGYGVVFGSPWNLRKNSSGRLTLFDAEIDVLIRHYKTDWWCERNNVWKDAQDIPDSRPLLPLIDAIANPLLDGKLNVVNPFINELHFEISCAVKGDITIQLIDLTGRSMFRKKYTVYQGINSLTVNNTENLSTGIYILRVESSDGIYNQRVMKIQK